MVVHPKVSSSKSFFDANAGLSVCTKHPEHISNEQRDFATMSRPKLTSLSRAEMACLHSTVMSSIRWVLRPSRLVFGVFSSIRGANANDQTRVPDEQQRRNGGVFGVRRRPRSSVAWSEVASGRSRRGVRACTTTIRPTGATEIGVTIHKSKARA